MGKGARNRRERGAPPTVAGEQLATGPFFHGGVPGKNAGDLLLSADRLGLRFDYRVKNVPYNPAWVYITTDPGVAQAYASRYLAADGQHFPGDVYEVRPIGGLQADPDHAPFPESFVRCPRARIVQVVARSVVLTDLERAQLERRYMVWGHRDRPIWDEDGLIIPSEQMIANGITREWTTLLRPWLDLADVDARGRLEIAARADDFWATMLDVVPTLDRDHRIHRARRWPGRRPYECVCGAGTDDPLLAAQHQLGDTAVRLIARIHSTPLPRVVTALAAAANARDPARWAWLGGPHQIPGRATQALSS